MEIYLAPQDNRCRLFKTIYLMIQLPCHFLLNIAYKPGRLKSSLFVLFLLLSKWEKEEIERAYPIKSILLSLIEMPFSRLDFDYSYQFNQYFLTTYCLSVINALEKKKINKIFFKTLIQSPVHFSWTVQSARWGRPSHMYLLFKTDC